MVNIVRKFPLVVLLGSLSACKKNEDAPVAQASLYDRLGGLPAVSAVVDQFITNVMAEPMTSSSKLKRTFDPLVQ